MDYFKIVLDGYFHQNNREHLEKYFFREFKKAEKDEFFEPDEFFAGCLKIIEGWEKYLSNKVFERKRELYLMLDGLKNGSISFNTSEGRTIEQTRQENIKYCEFELSEVRPDGIGSLSFTVDLFHLTGGRITYHLDYEELLKIKFSILKAFEKALSKETLPANQSKKKGKLTIDQIALKLAYEGETVTLENADEIISGFGLNAGKKLYQQVNFYSKRTNRLATLETKKKQENKIKLFQFVIDLLPSDKKQQAKDDLKILEIQYKAEYQ